MYFTPEIVAGIMIAIIGSQGFWAFVLYKVQKHDRKKDITTRTDLAILHDLVYKYTRKAIERGYTTFYEFENTATLYDLYKEYGGNGTGAELYAEFCKLPKKYNRIGDKGNDKRNEDEDH